VCTFPLTKDVEKTLVFSGFLPVFAFKMKKDGFQPIPSEIFLHFPLQNDYRLSNLECLANFWSWIVRVNSDSKKKG